MLTLLRRWHHSSDAQTLARPARYVFSRGDSNLVNWLHHGDTVRCVDFEFSGRSDIAFDAADQIEHISSRAIPDHTWHDLEAKPTSASITTTGNASTQHNEPAYCAG